MTAMTATWREKSKVRRPMGCSTGTAYGPWNNAGVNLLLVAVSVVALALVAVVVVAEGRGGEAEA
jgi:hypothetical protein